MILQISILLPRHNPIQQPHILFKVNEEAEILDEKRTQNVHTYVAKAIFATKRDRPDIQTAVAFLTTRVMTHETMRTA